MYRIVMCVAAGALFIGGQATAQQNSIKDQLVGTWEFVMCEAINPDGTKLPIVQGNNPAGQYIFTRDGHFFFKSRLIFRISRLRALDKRPRKKTGPQYVEQSLTMALTLSTIRKRPSSNTSNAVHIPS
jgi:Lipocalin-like domain